MAFEVNGGNVAQSIAADLSSTFNGYISAVPTLTAANNASSVAIVGVNTLSYAASFSANNIGAIYGAITGFNLQTFAGNATFANSNVASGGSSVNSIDFSSGGSTITMTQSSGIRVMSGQQNLFQYQGTNSGTITHAAISQNTGFYRPTAATGILTITNAYSHLINALDDYGAGFTFTNRWGIYQAGASDLNYFAANMLLGSTANNGNRLQVTGVGSFSSYIAAGGMHLNGFVNAPSGANLELGFDGTQGVIQAYNRTTSTWLPLYLAGSNIQFIESGTERMRLNATGLGIGTITPQVQLSIVTSGNNYGLFIGPSAGNTTGQRLKLGYFATANYSVIQSIEDGVSARNLLLQPDGGNLLVGTTTDGGEKLQVTGTIKATQLDAFTSEGGSKIGATHGTGGTYPKASGISFGATSTSISVSNNGGTVTFIGGAGIYANNTAASDNPTSLILWTTSGGVSSQKMSIKSNGIINLSNVPASSAGLVSGDIYQTAGVLNIVP
jgi:hypothetical protein